MREISNRAIHQIGQFGFGVSFLVLIVALGFNAPLIFDQLAPHAVTYDVPIKVLTPTIRAGDTFVLAVGRSAWNITGTDPVPAQVSRQLVRVDSNGKDIINPQIVVLPSVVLGITPGHTLVESRLSIIPDDLPPGYWRLEGVATARHKSFTYYTEPIQVLAP